jgi:hypothetical protein
VGFETGGFTGMNQVVFGGAVKLSVGGTEGSGRRFGFGRFDGIFSFAAGKLVNSGTTMVLAESVVGRGGNWHCGGYFSKL